MNDVAAALLAWLVLYSYPVVGLTVLAAAGIAADGDPDPAMLAVVILLAAVCGDLLSYGIARCGGTVVLDRLGPRVGLTSERIEPLERRFDRWGGLLVVVTRCLLTGLALPTNLVAGVGGYPVRRFLGCAILGEAIWTGGLMALGWWYGSNWVALVDYVDDAFTALTALAAAALLATVLVRLVPSKTT